MRNIMLTTKNTKDTTKTTISIQKSTRKIIQQHMKYGESYDQFFLRKFTKVE